MKIPSPQELGFPPKFSGWRPAQVDLLQSLLLSQVRVKTISAPTGFGKSAVYVAYALITKRPTAFITESRGLQDQLTNDFGGVGMVDLRGRRNYPCDLQPDYTCEDGYAARCPYKGTILCPSSQAEMRAAVSWLVVTNYDKWTAARKFGTGMSHFSQVVFDEGHKAVDAVARAMQVVLHRKEIEETLRVNFPMGSELDEMVNWKTWAMETKGVAQDKAEEARKRIQGLVNPKPSWVRHFLHMKMLVKRLGTLATANPAHWITDEHKTFKGQEDGYQFDPLRPGRYAEAALLLRIPSVVFVSATIRPKTMYMLHLPKESFQFLEFNSDFDPKRCPIYHVPTMQVDRRATDLSALWLKLDQIAARRSDRKGIVQTISFARRDEIMARSRFAPNMLVNARGEAPTDIVDLYKSSDAGTILVSPSVSTGYDFPGSQCEWQFICKIPFPDSRSKIIKARQEDDKEYGPYQAMNQLVQICGRGMRSQEDQCENFIPDNHIQWFLPRYSHLAPKWFKSFYKEVSILPAPPPRL